MVLLMDENALQELKAKAERLDKLTQRSRERQMAYREKKLAQGKRGITFMLDATLNDRVDELRNQWGITKEDAIERIIEAYFDTETPIALETYNAPTATNGERPKPLQRIKK